MLQTANQQTHFHKWRNPNYSILAFCILFDFTSLLHKLHIKCNKQANGNPSINTCKGVLQRSPKSSMDFILISLFYQFRQC